MKSDITTIIPIHEMNENLEKYFNNAIKSIENQITKPDEVLIVAASNPNLIDKLSNFNYGGIQDIVRVIENTDETDVCAQLNLGIANIKTNWFSFLEIDDEYSKIWFSNFLKYKEKYSADIYLPIVVDVDKEDKFIGFMNEAVWASEFSDDLGYLDNDALLRYQNFNIDGMIMNKDAFDQIGGFKSNIKLTFIYEFLLRATYNALQVMVIPKLGYKHINHRDGSLFANYVKEMDEEEPKFWLETAKKEYFYDYQREITKENN